MDPKDSSYELASYISEWLEDNSNFYLGWSVHPGYPRHTLNLDGFAAFIIYPKCVKGFTRGGDPSFSWLEDFRVEFSDPSSFAKLGAAMLRVKELKMLKAPHMKADTVYSPWYIVGSPWYDDNVEKL